MAIRPIGRVAVEAGTIVTTTRTTTHTAPGGGARGHARPRSAQAVGAAPATPTALPQESLDAQGAPATLHDPGPHHLAIAAARAPKMQRTSRQKPKRRSRVLQQTAVPSRRRLEVNGSTMKPALNEAAQTLRKRILMAKGPQAAVLFGKPSAAHLPLQKRVPHRPDRRPPSVALGSSRRKMPKLEIRLCSQLPLKSMSTIF